MPKHLIFIWTFFLSLNSFSQTHSPELIMTPEEYEWLQVNVKEIIYTADPFRTPREFIDKSGNHQGIVANYIKVIPERPDIRFQLVEFDHGTEFLKGLKSREVDFIGSIHKSSEKEDYLRITEPFLTSPAGIIVKNNHEFNSPDTETGKMEVACPNSNGKINYIRKAYPEAEIVARENDFSVLMKIAFGDAAGTLRNLMTASYLVDVHEIQKLQLIKTLDFIGEIGIGIVKNHPELYSILKKALKTISASEHEEIYNSRASIRGLNASNFFEKHQKIIFWVLVVVFTLSLIIIGVSIALNRLVANRTNELNQKMKKMAGNEEKYRLLVENQTDFIVEMDLGGRFLFVSSSFCRFFGKTEEELLGTRFHQLLHKTDLTNTEKEFKKMFTAPYQAKVENRVHTEDGIRWLAWTGRGALNEKGEVVGAIAIGRDVTEKKRDEKELVKAKEKAEESDRLKSAFLANISHEIRTPVNSIMGFASLMPEEENNEMIFQYAEIIRSNSELLVHIIDDIVLYSRLQSRSIQKNQRNLDVSKLLDELKQLFDLPEYQKRVRLLIENRIVRRMNIRTDYEKLKQLLINLTGNAFKYTLEGTITIRAEEIDRRVVFSVKDTGIGIPKDDIERIFERFFRGQNSQKETIPGTGLGLSIVKELAELLDGEIWVESNEGKGSCFYFALHDCNLND